MPSCLSKTLLREPSSIDGTSVFQLVSQCPPLDANSLYCNLLQCTHFSSTSVVAEQGGKLVGFISGYLKPDNPSTLFIWQVAVDEVARGMGLATKMLQHILVRPGCQAVNRLEATITPNNQASWALFEVFARKQGCSITKRVLFDRDEHFQGIHETEYLVEIGPFAQRERRSTNDLSAQQPKEIHG